MRIYKWFFAVYLNKKSIFAVIFGIFKLKEVFCIRIKLIIKVKRFLARRYIKYQFEQNKNIGSLLGEMLLIQSGIGNEQIVPVLHKMWVYCNYY